MQVPDAASSQRGANWQQAASGPPGDALPPCLTRREERHTALKTAVLEMTVS